MPLWKSGLFRGICVGWAIAKRTKELVLKDPAEGKAILDNAGGDINQITPRQLSEAYEKGNPLAKRIIEELIDALAAGSMSIVNALNPRLLIFGGGIIKGMPFLINPVGNEIKKRALALATKQLEIKQAQLTTNAGVIGAAVYGIMMQKKGAER